MNNFSFASQIGRKPDQWAAAMLTGHTFFSQGRLQEAARVFEGMAAIDSHNPYVQGILGSIYQKQKQWDVAFIRYNNAIALNPKDISAFANRGEILLKLGKFQEAAADLRKAIELDPQKKDPAANRARLLVTIVQDAVELAQQKGVEALQNVRSHTK